MTLRLVAMHGTGDAYMTLAFANAVRKQHGVDVVVAVKPEHEAVARMFPSVDYVLDPYIANVEADTFKQQHYNNCIDETTDFYAHPSFVNSGVRIDHLALLGRRLTHADLWRAMLKLDPATKMERGKIDLMGMRVTNDPEHVLLIPEARSWPNSYPEFWETIRSRLLDAGYIVSVNDPKKTSLVDLINSCYLSDWVIGPQCGIMAIICHAQFPCAKTIATPSVDHHSYFRATWPYASVETFAGENYGNVSEVIITPKDMRNAVELTLMSRLRGEPKPSASVLFKMSMGDFLDRLSILEIKFQRLTGAKKEAVTKEFLETNAAAGIGFWPFELGMMYTTLKRINEAAWDHNEVSVTDMYKDGVELSEHFAKAARFNRERVKMKNDINRFFNSPMEVKSYYDGEGTK